MNQWLVSFDTDRIKDYVFATDKLREIRGASHLLSDLNATLTWDEIQKVCPDECERIYFAGGGGAVLAPSKETAEKIIVAVENLYQKKTHTASITAVAVPLSPATKEAGFGRRVEFAGLRLRAAKDKKARRFLCGVQPYTQPCSACETYPAARISPLDQRPVCDSCHAKREVERERRKEEDANRAADRDVPRLSEELSELGDISHPGNYIGFIFADGNNMGRLLAKFESAADYQNFAKDLNSLVDEVVENTFKSFSPRKSRNGVIQPYEKLLVGGDDLIIVTAADIALDAALKLATYFEEKSPALLRKVGLSDEKPLTLGIGVVIAHSKFPIVAFNRLANQLQKNAKQRCAEIHYQTSAIDFMVVNAAGSVDVNPLRKESLSEKAFAFPHSDCRASLTQRPYTPDELNALLDQVRAFKREGFPRNQLQYLYEGLFESLVEAVYRWQRVAGRARKEHRELMDNLYQKFGTGQFQFPPWRKHVIESGKDEGNVQYTSELADLVEIYPFVPLSDATEEFTNVNHRND